METKITNEILQCAVDILNRSSKGKYALYFAYGKVSLVKTYPKGGQTPISGFMSKKELANLISALINYSRFEEE